MGNQHPGKLPVVAPRKVVPPRPFSRKIVVSLGRQVLTAFESDGKVFLECDCVTGDSRHPTERGTFYILRKERTYRSGTYHAQMDYAMFFTRDGKAIHKANSVWGISMLKYLGVSGVGSHGCVRVTESDARKLFDWAPMTTMVQIAI